MKGSMELPRDAGAALFCAPYASPDEALGAFIIELIETVCSLQVELKTIAFPSIAPTVRPLILRLIERLAAIRSTIRSMGLPLDKNVLVVGKRCRFIVVTMKMFYKAVLNQPKKVDGLF